MALLFDYYGLLGTARDVARGEDGTTIGDLLELVTESVIGALSELDTLPVAEIAAEMNRLDQTVPLAVRDALPEIVPAIEDAAERFLAGGRLIYIGAGTSGRVGVLDASEAVPTFGIDASQVQGIIAGGPSAVTLPTEGAEDDAEAGATAIRDAAVGPLDTVIGLASSGRTPYVLRAMEEAGTLGALRIGISCNSPAALSKVVDHAIEVVVGPEIIGGSTRLKAGTAQKLVVNMISTIVMVKAGKTYGNLMVDVRASNDKLRRRAVAIVREVSGADEAQALAALEATDFEAKPAILMIRAQLDAATARARLDAHGGRLREALKEVQ